MAQDLFSDLTLNALFLLVICIVFVNLYIRYRNKKALFNFIMGCIVGIVGLLLLVNTVTLEPGYVFDTRSILVCVSGMFFGVFPTLIGSIIICAYRVYIGGSGVYIGVLVTLASAEVGLLWKRFRWEKILKHKDNKLEFYLVGLITHVIMLGCVLTLPRQAMMQVLQAISLPVIIIFPVITMILCMVIFDGLQKNYMNESLIINEAKYKSLYLEYEEKEALLVCLLNSIPDMIFYKDKNSRYLGCNYAFEKYIGLKEAKIKGKSVYDIFEKERADQYRALDISAIEENGMQKFEEKVIYPDGSIYFKVDDTVCLMLIVIIQVGKTPTPIKAI